MRHLDDAFLDNLADSVSHALADNGESVLVHAGHADDGADVGVLPLDGRAPADLLFGTVAPAHWAVLGVAARGRAGSLDRPGDETTGIELVVLVARDGRIVGRLRQGDRVTTEPPATGVTLDCLQRALGLPTAPPEAPPTHLVAAMWLDQVVRAAGRRRAALRWDALDLSRLSIGLDWGEMRRMAVEGGWPERNVSREEAAWLDDGAFARWVLSSLPPVPHLVAEMRRVLRPSDVRRCLQVLRRLGVDAAAA